MQFAGRLIALAVLYIGAGCTPTFDWREVRASEGLVALFPCRPTVNSRQLVIAGTEVMMELRSCTAGGLTFAVGLLDATDASRVAPIMDVLRQALHVNLALPDRSLVSATGASGMQTEIISVEGIGPDGQPLQARSRVFSKATTVFQATVMGSRLQPEAVDFFFSSLKAR